MSGFLLWWTPGGAPLPVPAMGRIEEAMRSWAPDGVRSESLAGAASFHGHFDSAGGAESGLPLVTEEWLLTGSLRLDDRGSLRAALRDGAVRDADDLNDARLVLAALHTWGDGAAQRLRGDFAFVALDRRRHRVIAARSAFGLRPLLASRWEGALLVASDTRLMAAARGAALEVDEMALGEFLREGLLLRPTGTYRRGVERVPPAVQWTWDERLARVERACWSFPRPAALRRVDERVAVEGFRDVLGAAVSDRLRGPRASILLSGGLDSTALAATARRARPEVELHALTIGADPVIADDEPEWAARAADALGLPLHAMRDQSERVLVHVADRSVRTDEPIDEPDLLAFRSQVGWLASRARLTIYGEDGDALLAAPPIHSVLRAMGVRAAIAAWLAYRVSSGERPWLGLREFGPVRRWRAAHDERVPSWLRTVNGHAEAAAERPSHPTRPNAVGAFERPTWEAFVSSLAPDVLGVAHDFTLPLLDERVVAFVFALPPIPWCQRKYLLRTAFAGDLPAELLTRPKTPLTGYDDALVARWRARGGADMQVPTPMEEWVDVPKWRAVLRSGDQTSVREAWRVFEASRWLAQEVRQ